MKTPPLRLPLLLASGVFFAACSSAPPAPKFDPADGRVTITFQDPEKFTDAGELFLEHSNPKILGQLADFLQGEIRRYLPAGEKISLTFSDIDRAGDYDPLSGGRDHVRVIKSNYPPRFDFSYVRTAADGHVIAQGKQELMDLSFPVSDNFNVQNDPLYYDKLLLKKWIKATFQP
jgi:hypothetical protein